jgi:hypothetical protein
MAMDRELISDVIINALKAVKGLKKVSRLRADDYPVILQKEREAEERSLMGLGKVINSGVTEVLKLDLVFAALTTMEFDWGPHATLVLKKGTETVGEEVRDKAILAELSKKKDVWFLHRNFVVYKNKVSFPQDIMKKVCHFEIPFLPAEFCILDDDRFECRSLIFANPSTLCDMYIKEQYFSGVDERGLGTILVGADV